MNLRATLRPFASSVIAKVVRHVAGSRWGLSGDYSSWQEAVEASSGYDAPHILEKTKTAVMRVKNGEAAYERDSVLFDQVVYSWPVLAGLMWAAAANSGTLNVLDFGGSLGSGYFQNRAFLFCLDSVRWNVVEQPHYVAAGQQHFEDERLKFYQTIDECIEDTCPNVVILSSVLQYLEKPYDLLAQISKLPMHCVIIDRTPFWHGLTDKLCVQRVPPSIYPASYPSWIFSEEGFRSKLADWSVVASFTCADRLPAEFEVTYMGLVVTRPRTMT